MLKNSHERFHEKVNEAMRKRFAFPELSVFSKSSTWISGCCEILKIEFDCICKKLNIERLTFNICKILHFISST